MSNQITVLLIEDKPEDTRLFTSMLVQAGGEEGRFVVQAFERLRDGLERLSRGGADVVLLDLFLPDSQGFETFDRVHTQAPEIPVVVLTACDDDTIALEAVRKGAQDYLVKGEGDGKILARVIRYAIERQRLQAALRGLSMIDPLTGLYNRRGFYNLAEQHLRLAQRTKRGLILMLADVDRLKRINDTYGHPEGDLALIRSAEVLKGTFRTSDVLARIGGDEFGVIAIEAREDSAEALTLRLQGHLKAYNAQERFPYQLSLSIGFACLGPSQPCVVDELIAQADSSLYQRKRLGRGAP